MDPNLKLIERVTKELRDLRKEGVTFENRCYWQRYIREYFQGTKFSDIKDWDAKVSDYITWVENQYDERYMGDVGY